MANYEHLRWRRLQDEMPVPKKKTGFGPKAPFRPRPQDHGDDLLRKLSIAERKSADAGEAFKINAEHLRVLQFSFLDWSDEEERKFLEVNFGAYVIEQQDFREFIDPPYFTFRVEFFTPRALEAFLEESPTELERQGIIGVERVRNSTGEAEQQKLLIKFADDDDAKAFINTSDARLKYNLEISQKTKIEKVSFKTVHRFIVQFPTANALQLFQDEMMAYQSRQSEGGTMTLIQRNQFFDSLEGLDFLDIGDRRGARLSSEGVPDTSEFYLDVDLWHPGSTDDRMALVQEFREFITTNAGVVTDGPSEVVETLLLARVRANRGLLEALLTYDKVARVDLPPKLTASTFSIFDGGFLPDAADMELGPDAPLACVVDSGLVAGHPLLSGLVVDERDFDSGENTVVDRHGHGTHVAGIVAYGDIPKCLVNRRWIPKVRLLSAKVLRRDQQPGFEDSPSVQAVFSDVKRVETQLADAITFYAREYGCRIFNLSLGHQARAFTAGRQLPWGYVLDELALKLNVVLIVSAGNSTNVDLPTVSTSSEFQSAVRENVFSDSNPIIDPAYSALSLTVGSIARTDVSSIAQRQPPGQRPSLVASPANTPSPFTRVGLISEIGSGLQRVIKPDLVAFGGNLTLNTLNTGWNPKDVALSELSANFSFPRDRLLTGMVGTSQAAPYVTHVAAQVEARGRQSGSPFSADLIRALTVHSAHLEREAIAWIEEGQKPPEGERRRLRSMGYGKPDTERACFSSDNRVVLTTEDTVGERIYHLYQLELPDNFLDNPGRRRVRVTLAFSPPVRGSRKEYLQHTMWFRLYKNTTDQYIRQAMNPTGNTALQPPAKLTKFEVNSRPTLTTLQWSTVQSATFESNNTKSFGTANSNNSTAWHIVVACVPRFPSESNDPRQPYALVVSLEHDDERVQLYQSVQQRVTSRVRV
jgi:subtilisin family serine protease